VFALEDCRNLTRRLEADLIRAGEGVLRVLARLMATARRTGRELGKSDPIDALAAARAALREPGLPVAQLDGETRRLRLLVDHREDMVGERTRMQSRLRWHVHGLFPGLEIAPKSLGRLHAIAALDRRLHKVDGTVAAIARELLGRIRDLTVRIADQALDIDMLKELSPGNYQSPSAAGGRSFACRNVSGSRSAGPAPAGQHRSTQRHHRRLVQGDPDTDPITEGEQLRRAFREDRPPRGTRPDPRARPETSGPAPCRLRVPYNSQRPDRGLDLKVPECRHPVAPLNEAPSIERHDVLGGLIHEYHAVAA
jgi:hypothetical protein